MDSIVFSQFIGKQIEEWGSLVFVIGGAHGVDESIRQRANKLVKASDMIWTRNLFRLMSLEQLYRALEIQGGSNFHKE